MKTRSQHSNNQEVAKTRRKTRMFEENPKDMDAKRKQKDCAAGSNTAMTKKRKKLSPQSREEWSPKDDCRKITSDEHDSVGSNGKVSSDGSFIDEEENAFTEMEKEMEDQIKDEMQHKENQEVLMLFRDAIEKNGNNADEESEEKDPEKNARGLNSVDQLMILLEKAAICSKFIAENLAEVMSPDEKRIPEMAENKRKSGRKNSVVNKRQKMGSTHLAQIIANDMEKREAKDEMMKFPQPPNLANGCELKDYQLEGLRWLSALYQNGVSGILADDMGLGKTMQSIAMIAYLLDKKVRGPFLVVAPLATLPNWIREFQKWLPGHPVVRYHGLAQEREKLLKGPLHYKNRLNEEFPCIITSYECLMKDRVQLDKLSPFEYVIVDEGHRLKNHRCALTVCLKRFKINNRLLLTGTPIQNDLDELWSLLNFVNPAIFDDLPKFKSWFKFQKIGQNVAGATSEQDVLTQEENNRVVTILHEIIRPFLLRRTKVDVLSELPPKKEVVVYSGISSLQAEYAQLIENGTLREELMNLGIEVGRHISQTNKTMNHRKNTNHPFLFGEPLDPDSGMPVGTAHPQLLLRASGKFALLDRMLVRLHNDGRKVLVFSQMTRMLDIIEDYLIFRQWNYCRIDGSTDIDDRQKEMDVFNAEMLNGAKKTRNMAKDRHFVFLLSTRAGGVGINLTAADTCIIFDSDWNPHTDCQAMDRCHRIGQTLPVVVYRLVTVNSVDVEMMEKQISKKKLERMTIVGGDYRKACARSRGVIKQEHLRRLLQSDIKGLSAKGDANDSNMVNVQIDDEEFDMIMDRNRLFASESESIPTEGKMYDIIEAASSDIFGN